MLKLFLTVSLFLAVSAAGFEAHGSAITYQVREIDQPWSISDYAVAWASQTSTIETSSLSDFNESTAGNNHFVQLRVDFETSEPMQLSIAIAPDADWGGALYLDNQLIAYNPKNLWWDHNWNNVNALLMASGLFPQGPHVLRGFWAENCCSGGQGAIFSDDGGDTWKNLSESNLDALATKEVLASPVPVPAAIWMFGGALIGLRVLNSPRKIEMSRYRAPSI